MSTTNNVIPFTSSNNNTQTMGSRELSEVSGVRHDNVVSVIQDLENKGIINTPEIQKYSNGGRGQPAREYFVNQRDSYIVMARLSPQFTARLVDRWKELEEEAAQPAYQLPSNYVEALEHLVASEKKNIEQQLLLNEQQPKVDFFDQYIAANDLLTFREVAKILNAKEQNFRSFLVDNKYLYQTKYRRYLAYSNHIQANRFDHVISKNGTQCMFTPKGLTDITSHWNKAQQQIDMIDDLVQLLIGGFYNHHQTDDELNITSLDNKRTYSITFADHLMVNGQRLNQDEELITEIVGRVLDELEMIDF